jgi:hypothetical protein
MFEEQKTKVFSLHIKQRLVWGALVGLVTFSFGLAVAFFTFDHQVILNEALTMHDSMTYKVITNSGP